MATWLTTTTTKKNSFLPYPRIVDNERTTVTSSHQPLESRATSTEVSVKSMKTLSQRLRKRTMNSLFWRLRRRSRVWWLLNLGQSMISPSVWALTSPRLKQVQIKLERLWLVVQSDSQTQWAISSKRRVPRTNHLSSLFTRIVNRRSGIHLPTNSRENRHIFHTTRPRQRQNKNLRLFGSTIRISNWLKSVAMRRRPLICVSGLKPEVAWNPRSKDAKNTSMRQPTLKKLAASYAPIGKPRIGTLTQIQRQKAHHLTAAKIAARPITKNKGTKWVWTCSRVLIAR